MYIPTFPMQSATQELAYVELWSNFTITSATEAGADTVISAPPIVFDGSTRVRIEFFAAYVDPAATAGSSVNIFLFDGSTSQGFLWSTVKDATATSDRATFGCMTARFLTPTAASHTYSIRADRTNANALILAGNSVFGNFAPSYMRIARA